MSKLKMPVNYGSLGYMTVEELATVQQPMVQSGYAAFNGYVFSQYDADLYNLYTEELNRTRSMRSRNELLDRRHQTFCMIIGLIK